MKLPLPGDGNWPADAAVVHGAALRDRGCHRDPIDCCRMGAGVPVIKFKGGRGIRISSIRDSCQTLSGGTDNLWQ